MPQKIKFSSLEKKLNTFLWVDGGRNSSDVPILCMNCTLLRHKKVKNAEQVINYHSTVPISNGQAFKICAIKKKKSAVKQPVCLKYFAHHQRTVSSDKLLEHVWRSPSFIWQTWNRHGKISMSYFIRSTMSCFMTNVCGEWYLIIGRADEWAHCRHGQTWESLSWVCVQPHRRQQLDQTKEIKP